MPGRPRILNFVDEFCRAFRRRARTYSLADYLVVVESDVNLQGTSALENNRRH